MPRRPRHPGRSTAASDLIRARLRAALKRKRVSQVALARRLAKHTGRPWPPSRLCKLLRSHGPANVIFRVEDLALIGKVAKIPLAELVCEPDRTLVDLTRAEVQVLQRLRDDPELAAQVRALLPSPRIDR